MDDEMDIDMDMDTGMDSMDIDMNGMDSDMEVPSVEEDSDEEKKTQHQQNGKQEPTNLEDSIECPRECQDDSNNKCMARIQRSYDQCIRFCSERYDKDIETTGKCYKCVGNDGQMQSMKILVLKQANKKMPVKRQPMNVNKT